MDYPKIRTLKKKLYFTIEDLVDILKIKPESAWVLCNRNIKNGGFIRLKNNFYVLSDNWESFSQEQFFKIANYLQVPSYISFMTALSIYDVTTQVQRNYFESVSVKRSKKYDIQGVAFNFYKLSKNYYFNFIKKGDVFIATKEKAFMDAVYLSSLGKYKLDFDSIDLNKLDKKEIKRILKRYPMRTKAQLEKVCGI